MDTYELIINDKNKKEINIIINEKTKKYFIKKFIRKINKLPIGNIYKISIASEKSPYYKELCKTIEAIKIKNIKEKYTYIYDYICNELDKKI